MVFIHRDQYLLYFSWIFFSKLCFYGCCAPNLARPSRCEVFFYCVLLCDFRCCQLLLCEPVRQKKKTRKRNNKAYEKEAKRREEEETTVDAWQWNETKLARQLRMRLFVFPSLRVPRRLSTNSPSPHSPLKHSRYLCLLISLTKY